MPAHARKFSRSSLLLGCAFAAAVACAEPLPSSLPDAPDVSGMPVAALERAFWVCDHTATVHGVEATPVATCTSVFEAVKEKKFGGDFLQLLAWWRENKRLEHTRLERP
jgi:hypothetical protein